MTETDIKYLAGLLDADGSFFISTTNKYPYFVIALDLTVNIDRDMKYSNWLCEQLGVKPILSKRDKNWSESIKIVVSKRSTLEKLIPRILKYLVIKGKHLDTLWKEFKSVVGAKVDEETILKLKELNKTSRENVGPLKNKEWLPKAYVAGFLDGDGNYNMKKSSGTYRVVSTSDIRDRVVADLLLKQYGGYLTYQDNCVRWNRSLGRTNKTFAIRFLQDMHRHSRLKRHKIEQFLSYHSQRLNVESSTEQVIV